VAVCLDAVRLRRFYPLLSRCQARDNTTDPIMRRTRDAHTLETLWDTDLRHGISRWNEGRKDKNGVFQHQRHGVQHREKKQDKHYSYRQYGNETGEEIAQRRRGGSMVVVPRAGSMDISE
jgi:hypothetical protein